MLKLNVSNLRTILLVLKRQLHHYRTTALQNPSLRSRIWLEFSRCGYLSAFAFKLGTLPPAATLIIYIDVHNISGQNLIINRGQTCNRRPVEIDLTFNILNLTSNWQKIKST